MASAILGRYQGNLSRVGFVIVWAIATLAVTSLLVVVGSDPSAGQANPDENDPAFWGETCFKIDDGIDSTTWVADDDYLRVVLKAANDNVVFNNVSAGDVLDTGNGHNISHFILCPHPETSTTTTTTTTTTSSVPVDTTTTTTTTSSPPTDTTQVSPSPTTTTVPTATTTVPTAVLPEVVVAQVPDPVPTQPSFTG